MCVNDDILLMLNVITLLPPVRFWKMVGAIVLESVAVSADVLPYISVAIIASFSKFVMCIICKNNIAKTFLEFLKILKILNCSFDGVFYFW